MGVQRVGVTVTTPSQWEEEVFAKHEGRCANCGAKERLRARMIVPEEAGGRKVVSNGTVLCRACELASGSISFDAPTGKRPVDFWISRSLSERLVKMLSGKSSRGGFSSRSALLRYLMQAYVTDPERFTDLSLYQDSAGSADVKVNFWVEVSLYTTFLRVAKERGLTVTAALEGLLLMYEQEAIPLMRDSKK